MRGLGLLGVLVAVGLSLMSCDGEAAPSDSEGAGGPRASEADAALPDCQGVWVEGMVLSDDYAGCSSRDGERVLPDLARCSDGSGRRFVSYPDEGLYAALGEAVQRLTLPSDWDASNGMLPSIVVC